jgi:hypothetical protein
MNKWAGRCSWCGVAGDAISLSGYSAITGDLALCSAQKADCVDQWLAANRSHPGVRPTRCRKDGNTERRRNPGTGTMIARRGLTSPTKRPTNCHSSVRRRGSNGLLLRLSAEGRLELFQLLAVSAPRHQTVKSSLRRL